MKKFKTIEKFFDACVWIYDFDKMHTSIVSFSLRLSVGELRSDETMHWVRHLLLANIVMPVPDEVIAFYNNMSGVILLNCAYVSRYVEDFHSAEYAKIENYFLKYYGITCFGYGHDEKDMYRT